MPRPLIRISPEGQRRAATALLEAGAAIQIAARTLAAAAIPALDHAGRAIARLRATGTATSDQSAAM